MNYFFSLQPEVQTVLIDAAGILLTAFVSLAVAAAAYVKSKKIKLFEAFFEKKTLAYENFIEIVVSQKHSKLEDFEKMAQVTATALMYCSPDLTEPLKQVHNTIVELDRIQLKRKDEDLPKAKELVTISKADKDLIIDLFSKDIQRCMRFKFKLS